MIRRIRDFHDLVSNSIFALRSGMSFRFVLANLIMRDELRRAVAFARIDVDVAIRFFDINPVLAKKRLKQAFDGLSDLFE